MICPNCGSTQINQYRMMTGPIWCENCGFKAEDKQIHNPFVPSQSVEPMLKELWTEQGKIDGEIKIILRWDNEKFHSVSIFPPHNRYKVLKAIEDLFNLIRKDSSMR